MKFLGDMGISGSTIQWLSIILFRLENERPENINKHLAIVLNNFKIELLKGCIISVTEKKYRIRELPFNP